MEAKVKGINLLPNEYIVEQKISFYEKIIGIIAVAEVACFIGFVALPPKQELAETQATLVAKKAQLNDPKYDGVNKTLKDLEDTKTNIKDWLTSCESLTPEEFVTSALLDQLTSRVPANISLTDMQISSQNSASSGKVEQAVTLSGNALSTSDILSYLAVAEELFPTQTITHDLEYRKKTQDYGFNIYVKIEKVETPPETQTEETTTEETASEETSSENGEEDIS